MRKIFLGVLALAMFATVAQAASFQWPPEKYAPKWLTAFPYPRNIDWQFDTDPQGGPTAQGAPGAHYEGYLDPDLWGSDFVQFSGDVQWYDSLVIEGGQVVTGLIGIDNRTGTETLTGQVVFHIDNTPDLWQKDFWVELDQYITQVAGVPSGSLEGELVVPPPSVIDLTWDGPDMLLPNGFLRTSVYMHIVPNPPWEEGIITFTAPPGTAVLLDRLHVASECAIPEPATVTLLGCCLLGLGAVMRRKRK